MITQLIFFSGLMVAQAGASAYQPDQCQLVEVITTKADQTTETRFESWCRDPATGEFAPLRSESENRAPTNLAQPARTSGRTGDRQSSRSERTQTPSPSQQAALTTPAGNQNAAQILADTERLGRRTDRLLSQVNRNIQTIEASMEETARQGRELLKCDQLASAVAQNVGDPARRQPVNTQALRAMPREIAGFVDDCAKFRHGYLNVVAGYFRVTGFPLGYKSDSEAFDYFITASQSGYPPGAVLAGALLTSPQFSNGLTEQRVEQLAVEYERHGHDASELRASSAQYFEYDRKRREVVAELVANCRETDRLLHTHRANRDANVQTRLRSLYAGSAQGCSAQGVQLTRP